MKKYILIAAVVIAFVFAGWIYRGNLAAFRDAVAGLARSSKTILLSDIRRDVLFSGPLRNWDDAPDSRLSAAGVVEWTNRQRESQGLPPLNESTSLNKAAELKVKDMFEKQYFDHISPEGKGPADLAEAASYEFIAVGENLALGNYKDDQALVEAWMNSPGHRANIVSDKFQEIGVAVMRGVFEGKTTWLAVQEFGKPASACPQVDPFLKELVEEEKRSVDVMEAEVIASQNSLNSFKPQVRDDYEEYNAMVEKHNAMVREYNKKVDAVKKLVGRYNNQVKEYNRCAAQ